MFSSRSFMLLYLMFKSLSYFEFIFVQSVREYSNFMDLYETIQLFHLLKRQSVKRIFLMNFVAFLFCVQPQNASSHYLVGKVQHVGFSLCFSLHQIFQGWRGPFVCHCFCLWETRSAFQATNLQVAFCFFCFCFLSFQGRTLDIWRFPGWWSNQSYSCWPIPQPQQYGI